MSETTSELDLRAILRMLWLRKWIIITSTIILGSVALMRALATTPVYLAAVEVAVEPSASVNVGVFGSTTFTDQEIETQRRLAVSEQVAARVIERLALPDTPQALRSSAQANIVSDSRVLVIAIADPDPERAARVAQAFGEEYVAFRRADAVQRLVDAMSSLEAREAAVRASLTAVNAQLDDAEDSTEIDALEKEREALLDQLGVVQTSLAAFDAGEALVGSGGVILANAAVPSSPIEPEPVRSGVTGALLGLLLGAGLAIARDRFDDRLTSEHALASAAPNVSVLTRVPWHQEAADGELVTLLDPVAPASEAFRALRTQLRFVAGTSTNVSIAFTSAVEAEGKSTVAANYAVTAARAGYRTVLIDADLRKPRVHELMGIPNDHGLSHLLSAQARIPDASQRAMEHLSVITAGPQPPNPSELLGSQQFADLLDELGTRYDLVVLDTAPLLPVADGVEVATLVNAAVLVAHARYSRRGSVRAAVEGMSRVGVRLAGLVLTGVRPKDSVYERYYYRALEADTAAPAAQPADPGAPAAPRSSEPALWQFERD